MIKIILVTTILAVIFIMVDGIAVLKNNYYWRQPFFVMQWDYLKTEISFIDYYYGGIKNWMLAVRSDEDHKIISNKKATAIPILLYHGVIRDLSWKSDDVSVRLDDFKEQMFALKKAGYQTIRLEDYLSFVKGEKDLPEKSFVLTFDDGRKDSYYPADPILRVLGYSAVMNIITARSLGAGNEKSTFHLNQTEIRKMIDSSRWEIASHTRNGHGYEKIDANGKEGHFLSNKIWLDNENRLETEDEYKKRIYADLIGSKLDIEKNLGIKVSYFAYPFGDFGQASENFPGSRNIIIDMVKSIYPLAFVQAGSSDFPTNYAENSALAKRISVSSLINSEKLLNLLEGTQSKSITYEDNFSQNKGWIKGWGSMTIGKNGMIISDSQKEDSGLVFLSGSYLWKDYLAQAKIALLKGSAFAFSGRYYDENNYVSCDFSDGSISLTQRVKGSNLQDIEVTGQTNLSSGREAEVAIYVNKNQAGCYLDGKLAVSGTIENDLEHGGISFKIWDSLEKGTALQVKDMKVSSPPQLISNFN